MPAFRYIAAFAAACLIVLAGWAFCIETKRTVIETVREQLRADKKAGRLPAELKDTDIDNIELSDADVELPESLMLRIDIADFLSNFGIVLVPAVFVVCFGLASLFKRQPQ